MEACGNRPGIVWLMAWRFLLCVAGTILTLTTANSALADEKSPTNRIAVPGLAAQCTPDNLRKVAARLSLAVTIGQIPNGPKFPDGARFVAAKDGMPSYCQVTGSIVTNPKTGKTANFLATLPNAWNRKYLQFGCFGHCGFFALNDATSPLVTAVAQGYPGQILEKGYASFGTDEGHIGSAGGTWAIKGSGEVDDDAIDDFLYRSNKVLVQAGKAFTAEFYSAASGQDQRIAYSYLCGCSGGGRDALVAASYFPEEFDGIVAGSPYGNMANAAFQFVGTYLATLRSPDADVPPDLVAQIDPIVKAQCDGRDGVKDGLIQNPAACDFRPERDLPRCKDGMPGTDCFTQAQIGTISTVLTAVTDHDGNLVQPGYAVSEVLPFFRVGKRPADLDDPVPWDDGAGPEAGLAPLGDAVLKVFANRNDPDFNTRRIVSFGSGGSGPVTGFRAIVPRKEAEKAYKAVRMGIGSDPRNAGRLIRSGSRLLIWHNGSDEKLTPFISYNYYKQLAAMYGGYEKLQQSIRLFILPGTGHCSIGAQGPSNFDALGAIEDWVERGKGPDGIVAKLYDRVSPMIDPNKTPLRTMPLCKFPEMARYDGTGDVNEATSWSCAPDDRRMLEVGESGRQAGVIE